MSDFGRKDAAAGTIRLTPDQQDALEAIIAFLQDDELDAFVLRGSAGTGKTTLIAKLVAVLDQMSLSCGLMAPTGRAARILGNKIGQANGDPAGAMTIHRVIYAIGGVEVFEEAESANDPGIRMIFPLRPDEPALSLFIVDESSMVGDKETKGDFVRFGSGRLLSDLITYARPARAGRKGDRLVKLLFVGDPAQLPPVGDNNSPALSDEYLRDAFNLRVASFDLKTVMRQAEGSAILDRATELRDALLLERFDSFSLQPDGQDIGQVDATAAVDMCVDTFRSKRSGVVVVHSNAMALEYNRSVRERLWGDADLPIQVGDVLLVNRNSITHQLNNGDLVKVLEVAPVAERERIGLRGGHSVELSFRDATVAYRGADGSIIRTHCFILENLLDSPSREITPLEQRALLVHFRNRHEDLPPKSEEFRHAIRHDSYFNALQVKYGYAMTCHKAQGGEWDRVVVDFTSHSGLRSAAFFRWAYTAITRASKKLYVVNPPSFSAYSGMTWARPNPPAPSAPEGSDPEGLASDPDWLRFSFSQALAPLMEMHRTLRSAWEAKGISIEHLNHLQHCERYTLVRRDQRVIVQYFYDKNLRVSRVGPLPQARPDPQLLEDALAPLKALSSRQEGEDPAPFIRDFLDRLDAALGKSNIQRTGYKSMPYRLRVSLSDSSRRGEIDFNYDKKFTWTAAQEVGGPGSSKGLYDEVQQLLESHQEVQP